MSSVHTNTHETALARNAVFQTSEDLKTALLIVSAVINLFVFTAWLVVTVDPSLTLVLLSTN